MLCFLKENIDNNNDDKYDVVMLMQDTANFIVGEVNNKTHNISPIFFILIF